MKWTEYEHAWIVSEYYRLLKEKWKERGISAFRQAACTYGEQRGKRMAMRAIRDGAPLDLTSYFAYGEYASTPEYFQVDMWTDADAVNEKVTSCPWARLFAKRELKDCGAVYCREIDKAIIRGFNPELSLETASTQHYDSCCRFYFRQEGELREDLLEEAEKRNKGKKDITMPMEYHCGHVYHVFSAVIKGVFGEEGVEVSSQVLASFSEVYGPEEADTLRAWAEVPFDTIITKSAEEK